MSAIIQDGESTELVKVLFVIFEDFNALDFVSTLHVFEAAKHQIKDPESTAFDCTIASSAQHVMAKQGCTFQSQISIKEAHERLNEFDVLVIPGGDTETVLKTADEPIPIIEAFATLQQNDTGRERTLMSISTGSLLLAQAGVLQGLAATTDPEHNIALEKLCQQASAFTATERTDVMDERYVVNNARYDIDDEEQNPFVISKEEYLMSRKERRKSTARKGSNAWRESNSRRESNARRAAMRLGGLRVITAGATASGLDAALYLVCALVSVESAEDVARRLQYTWVKGVVVDAIDV